MQILLIYDVQHDSTRTKISELCQDYGLDRVQYSCFVGKLSRTNQEELFERIKKQLGNRDGDVRLLPICKKDWQQRLEIHNEKSQNRKPDNRIKIV